MKLQLTLVVWLVLLGYCVGLPNIDSSLFHTKFEFMQSFKGPYLIDAKGNIPYWTHGGSSIPNDDSVRVCPSVKSHRGWVWTKNSLSANHWFVDISLRVTGRTKTGADGMAFWVTASPGSEGTVYGNVDVWNGLALILDSFDNDGSGDNPKIEVVLNDGTRRYDHHADGNQQQSGSCIKDFRNRPYPVKIRLSYIKGVLEVWVHDGVTIMEDAYELCTKVENVPELSFIPKEMYFGVSAATGGLSDDHDVNAFLTYSVVTREEVATKQISQNLTAFNQLTDRYNQMVGDFNQQQEEYRKQHPDIDVVPSWAGDPDGNNVDWQKRLEMDQNIAAVADLQLALQREINAVTKKIDILISNGIRGPSNRGSDVSVDLEAIKNTERNILQQLADMRSVLDRMSALPSGNKVTTSEQLQPLYETKNLVSQQSQQLEGITLQLQELSQKDKGCPVVTNLCLSPWLFIVVTVIQVLIFFAYSLYVQAKERNAKKFF